MKSIVYLDHAATSYPKPPAVLSAVADCMKRSGGNPGRGSHKLALAAAQELYACRQTAAQLFGAQPERVIFTLNTTHAINLAIKGLLRPGDHAICSDMEHNAVYRPLYKLTADGIIDFDVFDTFPASVAPTDDRILSSLLSKIRPNTRIVICSHASNICSAVLPIAKIGALCRRMGILFVVDAAQSAGSIPLDMERMNLDILCLPGHKGLLGVQGTGMMILREGVTLETRIEGGNGIHSLRGDMGDDVPERYEPGTLPTPAVSGLRAGMEFVRAVGVETIGDRERRLGTALRDRLSELPKVTVYAPHRAGGVVLFSVDGYTSEEVGKRLDEAGVCVRPGFHCSALGHRTLQTPDGGAVRASFGWFSKERDAEALLKVVKRL